MHRLMALFLLAGLILFGPGWSTNPNIGNADAGDPDPVVTGLVFSALWVDFDLFTMDTHQLAAYYDVDRRMTVAMRNLDSDEWKYHTLASMVGWDSHNYITLAVDSEGYIHVSGNMHNVPLVYYRSSNPMSIDSFKSPGMVGDRETSVTYPALFLNNAGELHYSYRDGDSGDGTTVWNKYDTQTRTWSRLTAEGLFDGLGQVNAYHNYVPFKGPDDRFHIIFMWREASVANTNFHISHICSSDLLNWETYGGAPVSLPVTPDTPGVVVDPVESGNGLINMGFGIGWDQQERPVITYHKYDGSGDSQYYNARLENGSWQIRQTSQWSDGFTWDLDRIGSLPADVRADPVTVDPEGRLIQTSYRSGIGDKTWVLDDNTLAVAQELDEHPGPAIADLMQVESDFPNMEVHLKRCGDWYLRWETLPVNQDQAYPEPWPEPSMLTVHRLGR